MLQDLTARVGERGYQLTLTPTLVAALAHKGYDPRFGARPMARVFQDIIEERIATRIIEGSLQPGDSITLSIDDFSPDTFAVT
jgi:ATP-dependent Clp protease ATP-binding subunit ClpA